jgi:hypothetical protein
MGTLNRWKKIQARMTDAKAILQHTGGVYVQRKANGQTAYVVRYREQVKGLTCRRSIYLGDKAIATMAQDLIGHWRKEAGALSLDDRRLLQCADFIGSCRGYTGRARNRLRVAALESFEDIRTKVAFTFGLGQDDPAIRDGKRPGRPAKSGLW